MKIAHRSTCQKEGDTLGGIVEVRVEGVPFGLGTHAQWDRQFDGRLAQAVMSVQAIKGVEIGLGFEAARRQGSQVHDPIHYDPRVGQTARRLGFTRPSNNAGGLEAGHDQRPADRRPRRDETHQHARPAAGVGQPGNAAARIRPPTSGATSAPSRRPACVVENVVAFEVARAMVDKFGGDSLAEMQARWKLFHELAKQRVENGVDDGSKS